MFRKFFTSTWIWYDKTEKVSTPLLALFLCVLFWLKVSFWHRFSPYEWEAPHACVRKDYEGILINQFSLLNSLWFTIGKYPDIRCFYIKSFSRSLFNGFRILRQQMVNEIEWKIMGNTKVILKWKLKFPHTFNQANAGIRLENRIGYSRLNKTDIFKNNFAVID